MSSLHDEKGTTAPTSPPTGRRYGAIDIGSHTIRLLIAEFDGRRQVRPLLMKRHITRLARGFQESKRLENEAMRHSLEVLDDYARQLIDHQSLFTVCGATGVLRRAADARSFIREAYRRTGLRVKVLSELEEAVASAKGALSAVEVGHRPLIFFDLGGSSTEFVVAVPELDTPLFAESVFIGAATLTQRFLGAAPCKPIRVRQARQFVQSRLEPVTGEIQRLLHRRAPPAKEVLLLGTAGTVTTLAAMNLKLETYRPSLINGRLLSESWIDTVIDRLSRRNLIQRLQWPGLEAGREDIIVGGAVIVSTILKSFCRKDLIAVDSGLLEGLLIDAIQRHCGLDPSSLWTPLTWLWESE